jgi:dihydroorotate dehydrogenase electron transfer subunit
MVVDAPAIARLSVPGQFCMLTLPGVFLRRPLSIHAAAGNHLAFIYRVVGTGTSQLSRLCVGDAVQVLGPLGKGYPLPALRRPALPLLVAGGTGIASLGFLARSCRTPGILFYGARTKKDLICLREFRAAGWKIMTATDDGSAGFAGYVTDLFAAYLNKHAGNGQVMYTCGPHVMMKKAAAAAVAHGIAGYASLEEVMACGLGNCQGCAVLIAGAYKMACKDGPVFPITTIQWENDAAAPPLPHKGCHGCA